MRWRTAFFVFYVLYIDEMLEMLSVIFLLYVLIFALIIYHTRVLQKEKKRYCFVVMWLGIWQKERRNIS